MQIYTHTYTRLCTYMSVAIHGVNAHNNKGNISVPLAALCLSIKTTLHVVSLFYSTKSKFNSV
jgi:hypothetical protein